MSLSYSPGSLLYFEHTLTLVPGPLPNFITQCGFLGEVERRLIMSIFCLVIFLYPHFPLPPLPPPPYTHTHTHTHTHTNTVPSKLPAIGGRSAGHPDGEEGDEVPSDVRQHVGCVRHDGQTASQITPCEKKFLYNGRRERGGRWIDGLIEGLKTRVV